MKGLRALGVFCVAAVLGNVATVSALPWLINAYVLREIAEAAGGVNRPLPAPRADAAARTVVRPSPDLLYTACAFDIADGALLVSTPVPGSYLSVAGFAADTSNFFSISDAEAVAGVDGQRRIDVVLARAGAQALPDGVRVITPPSERGLILFRTLIADEAQLDALRALQSRQTCRLL